MWPDARVRQQLEHRLHHPEARAQHRHDDDVGARARRPRPSRAASRRAPASSAARASPRSPATRLSRCASRRKWLGRVSLVAQRRAAHPARSDGRRDAPARGNYTTGRRSSDRIWRDAQSDARFGRPDSSLTCVGRDVTALVDLALRADRPATPRRPRCSSRAAPSSRWTRRDDVIPNGAVAIDGDQIVAVGPADEIDAKYQRGATASTSAARSCCPA